jgi:hypothetical protein
MNLRRFFTFFLSTLLFAGAVSAEFNIAGLPTTGRCTAASFGRGPGDQSANRPDQSYQTKIGDISANKSGDNIVVSFNGVTPLFAGSGHSYWDEETQSWQVSTEGNDFLLAGMGVRAFPVIFRCDENSSSDTVWTVMGSSDSMVRTTDTSALISITDTSATTPSVYWYIATSLVNVSDAADALSYLTGGYCGGDTCDEEAYPAPDNSRTTLGAYNTALMAFNNSSGLSKMNWSDPLAVSVNTLPKQELAFGLDVSTNSTTVMTATTLGQSVSASFVATIDSYYASAPVYTWTTSLKVAGTDTNISDSGLVFTTNGNQMTVSGVFDSTKVDPASYELSVQLGVSGTSNSPAYTTTSKIFTWLVKPEPISLVFPAGPNLVDVGGSKTFTMGFDKGLSHYKPDLATADFALVGSAPSGVTADINGDKLTVTLADTASGLYNLTLKASDVCKSVQSCTGLLTEGSEQTFSFSAATPLKITYLGSGDSTNTLTSTTISVAGETTPYLVNPVFTATIDSQYVASPKFIWDGGIYLGSVETANKKEIDSILNIFPNSSTTNDVLSLVGTFNTTNSQPGIYTVSLSVKLDGITTIDEISRNFTWRVDPREIEFDKPAGATVNSLELATENTVTFNKLYGLSSGGGVAGLSHSWAVRNIKKDGVAVTDASILTIAPGVVSANAVTLEFANSSDNDDHIGEYTFDLTVTEICADSSPSYCADMMSSKTVNYKLVITGHEFDFDQTNRRDEAKLVYDIQANTADLSTLIPVYIQSNQNVKSDFIKYEFKPINMKDSAGMPLTTAAFVINSFIYNNSPIAVGSGSVNAGGFTLTTPSVDAQAIATFFRNTDNLTASFNDTFFMTLTAITEPESGSSSPKTTTVTMGFVVLEAQAPTVVASGLVNDMTDTLPSSYDPWPAGFTAGVGKHPVQTDAFLAAQFSEPVTGAKVKSGIKEDINDRSEWITEFANDDMAPTNPTGSDTWFRKQFTSDTLKGWIANAPNKMYFPVTFAFNNALDQNNDVNRNTVDETTATTTIVFVNTPDVESVTDSSTVSIPRDGSISVTFSEKVTDLDLINNTTGLGNFIKRFNADGNVMTLSPAPGRELVAPGSNSAVVTFPAGSFYNVEALEKRYPNITTRAYIFNFALDTTPPVLANSSVESDGYSTAVTYTLTFSELLNSTKPTVELTNLTDGTTVNINSTLVIVNQNMLNFSTSGLSYGKEYQFVVKGVKDLTGNSDDYSLDTFITLENDEQTRVDVEKTEDLLANDNVPPYIVELSPDFRLLGNRSNVPLRPQFTVLFSEQMADATSSALEIKKSGSSSVVPYTTDMWDGQLLVATLSVDLEEGAEYSLSFSTAAKDKAATPNDLETVNFVFTTYQTPASEEMDTNEAPIYMGNTIRSEMAKDAAFIFFFNEPVKSSSLTEAVTFTLTGSDTVLDGNWVVRGNDAYFNAEFAPAQSYTYSIKTSWVADLLDKKNPVAAEYTGDFRIKANHNIRDFRMLVDGVESTLHLTAAWLPPVDRSGITGYVLKGCELGSSSSCSLNVVTVYNSIDKAQFATSGLLTGFQANDSYHFQLLAMNGTDIVTSSDVKIYSVPGSKKVTRVVKNQHTSVELVDETETAKIVINPRALRESTNISVAAVVDSADTLKNKKGGGERYSDPIQFGPAGLEFLEPVVIGLKVSIPSSLKAAGKECVVLDADCEQAILNIMKPLVYDGEDDKWTGKSLSRMRVETIDSGFATYYARTPHFSTFMVAQSLNIAGPVADSNLQDGEAGMPYTTYVSLSGSVLAGNENLVAVAFSPVDGHSLSHRIDPSNRDRVEIYASSLQKPDTTDTVEVTVSVTDPSDDSVDTRKYYIKVLQVVDQNFVGAPHNVDYFKAYMADSTTADLSWAIDADANLRSINKIFVEYGIVGATEVTTSEYNRGVVSGQISGLTEGKRYWFEVYTKSYQGTRSTSSVVRYLSSFESGDVVKTSDGLVSVSGSEWLIEGKRLVSLSVNGLLVGDEVRIKKYSEADLNAQTVTGGILTAVDRLSNGVEAFPEAIVDLNFSGVIKVDKTASVIMTLPRTYSSNYKVYHWNGTAWDRLSSSTNPSAVIEAAVAGVDQTRVTITSVDGVGSPFAVANVPPTTVYRSGGGGGCSVAGNCCDEEHAGSWINFLLMLMPLGYLLLRKFK